MTQSAKMVVKNFQQFRAGLKKFDQDRIKAARTAAKVEGFRLLKALAGDIRQSAPGGSGYDPLSTIARRRAGRFMTRKPFTNLLSTAMAGSAGALGITKGIIPVRYDATEAGDQLIVSVGFTERLSRSWRRLGRLHQEGFSRVISDKQRRWLANVGAGISPRSKLRKFFFLKKKTRQFETPKREIVDPFWRAQESRTQRNLISNFERKLKGERI